MRLDGAWSDLDTRGFLVARSLLADDEAEHLRTAYGFGPRPDAYHLRLKTGADAALGPAAARIDELLGEIRAHTSLAVDCIVRGYFLATAYVNYGWHQDFELLSQDLENYLNVYVPILKPRVDKSNLSLVPFDALRAASEAAYRRLKGGFANVIIPVRDGGGQCRILHTRDRTEEQIPLDLDGLAVTPQLAVGDALLIRADVIHRTQDNDTERIATSFRVANSKSTLRRDVLMASGGLLDGQRGDVERLLACFDRCGLDEITIAQFLHSASDVAESS